MLKTLSNITDLTPATAKTLKLSDMLKIVNGTASNTKWVFPDPFPEIATNALERYERDNWGAAGETPIGDGVAANNDSHNGRPIAPNRPSPTPRHSPSNHPIFGPSGIMRGILVDTSGPKMKRSLDPTFPAGNSKIEGHNGLSIGQWWPFQICALRDGAHGSLMAGIAGGETEGAFSILVSGD